MDTVDRMLIEFVRMAEYSGKGEIPMSQLYPHAETIELTDDADEIISQIDNHESTYLDHEKVKQSIALAYEENDGNIPTHVRDRHITAVGRIVKAVRDEVLASGFMTAKEFDRAKVLVCKYVYQEGVELARERAGQ